MRLVAEAFLAEHPEDGDEPVTPEWATTIVTKSGRSLRYSGEHWIPTFIISVNGSRTMYELPIGATRRHVRQLLAALGVGGAK